MTVEAGTTASCAVYMAASGAQGPEGSTAGGARRKNRCRCAACTVIDAGTPRALLEAAASSDDDDDDEDDDDEDDDEDDEDDVVAVAWLSSVGEVALDAWPLEATGAGRMAVSTGLIWRAQTAIPGKPDAIRCTEPVPGSLTMARLCAMVPVVSRT
jgi:hypothetical protein